MRRWPRPCPTTGRWWRSGPRSSTPWRRNSCPTATRTRSPRRWPAWRRTGGWPRWEPSPWPRRCAAAAVPLGRLVHGLRRPGSLGVLHGGKDPPGPHHQDSTAALPLGRPRPGAAGSEMWALCTNATTATARCRRTGPKQTVWNRRRQWRETNGEMSRGVGTAQKPGSPARSTPHQASVCGPDHLARTPMAPRSRRG